MKRTFVFLLSLLLTVIAFKSGATLSSVPRSIKASDNSPTARSYESEHFIVAIDKNGDEVWIPQPSQGLSSITIASFELISFSHKDFTDYNYYDGSGNRVVQFYFMVDGVRYGPLTNLANILNETNYYQSNNYYTVFPWIYNFHLFHYYYYGSWQNYLQVELCSSYPADDVSLILFDKDGNEVSYAIEGTDGDVQIVDVELDTKKYGSGDVPFHFKWDFWGESITCGSQTDLEPAIIGVPYAQEIQLSYPQESETYNFTVPAGYKYSIGFFYDAAAPFLYVLQGEEIVNGSPSGDVNGDNIVDVSDIVSLIDSVLGNTTEPVDVNVADVNGDGLIDVVDVVALIDRVLNGN